ncbi:hypothetical protein KC19_12G122900 [Ceratodon purpureus]|uniref:Uncharacterized protein n=1 Tax=Ceratodon purpureus TaxID=3225 RepID=A0A8T0G731_CERPU|nr:hypothetical protein KC19_12G122900 [Ceratodon purpureus]
MWSSWMSLAHHSTPTHGKMKTYTLTHSLTDRHSHMTYDASCSDARLSLGDVKCELGL